MLYGYEAAALYGYSTARVKAMESKLIRSETLDHMFAAKDTSSIIGMLLQTSYKQYIEQFGGVQAMDKLIDSALSKSLGDETSKLITIAPLTQKKVARAVFGKWDIYNIKLVIEAKASGKKFEDIERYIVDSNYVGKKLVRDAMLENNVESTISKLMQNSHHDEILKEALNVYKKTNSIMSVNGAIDKMYYMQLSNIIYKLVDVDPWANNLVKKDIDMKNALLLIRAKRYGMKLESVKDYLSFNGNVSVEEWQKTYEVSKDFHAFLEDMKAFDLKVAIQIYDSSKNKSLLIFEIAIRNAIFKEGIRVLKHSVLSFGSLVAYFYLKEIEVFSLRILIKSKAYGLSDDEVKRMIIWKAG